METLFGILTQIVIWEKRKHRQTNKNITKKLLTKNDLFCLLLFKSKLVQIFIILLILLDLRPILELLY